MTHRFDIIGQHMPMALFIDGENVSAKHANDILALADTYGRGGLRGARRVYCNPGREDWIKTHGVQHVCNGAGRNAADITLSLDALEAVLLRGVRTVLIVSNDGDFTPLALKLAEHGARVIGIGTGQASEAFQAACDEFEELRDQPAAPDNPCAKTVATAGDTPCATSANEVAKTYATTPNVPRPSENEVIAKAQKVLASCWQDVRGMTLPEFGTRMFQQKGLAKRDLNHADWRAFLAAHEDLFALDPPPDGQQHECARVKNCPKSGP